MCKVINLNIMEVLAIQVAKTMLTMENIFPPSCFDVMTHLVVHLV
jgi:hypothetical protein